MVFVGSNSFSEAKTKEKRIDEKKNIHLFEVKYSSQIQRELFLGSNGACCLKCG